ncbi:MAG TPA: thioredoxin domain-containing protein [Longimicrobiaceae bacterium]|nr:thioredoxin domain-containing protein [Longimicrobiaceae bacterium]
MKDKLATLATAVLVLSALVVAGLVARMELRPDGRPLPAQGTMVANWRDVLGEPPGEARDEVLLAVFADYTCTFCRDTEAALDSLQAASGRRVRIRQVHFPLRPDGVGFRAAVAAECAKLQGAGPAYHRLLYRHQAALGTLPWDSLAVLAGVPRPDAFRACLGDARAADAVRRDRRRGEAVGVALTPTLLVDGRMYLGAAGYAELARRVERPAGPAPSSASANR